MDLNQPPAWATSFKFRKNNAHIMGLCLTYHVNLSLSLRKTAEAMCEIHNINISHTMVASYARTATVLIKPLNFIADGYSAYPLAAQQFKIEKGWEFNITQVIGLSNDDAVS